MAPPESLTRALLEESAWLQRLALRLAGDPARAEDATQEALLAGLARPPARGVPLRKWLAAVLRNAVRQERRARARREARERAQPSARESEPADALAERLELHARLVAAVRALDEPYRTTIALRFLEDLAPNAVAERLGVPPKTVHTRIERALEMLRARLDREHGGRAAWVALLVPATLPRPPLEAAPPAALSPLLAPFLAMGTLWKWTGAGAALTVLGFFTVRSLAPEPRAASSPAPRAEPPASAELAPPAEEKDVALLPASAERAPIAVESSPASAPAVATEAAPASLEGFVLDLDRRPVPGLTVRYEPISGDPLVHESPIEGVAESDERGAFALPLTDASCRILAHGRGYATVVAPGRAGRASPEPPVVFVGPERAYAGRVIDAEGAPVAEAEVSVSLGEAFARELVPGSFAWSLPIAQARSDADGHFELPSVGGAPGSSIYARSEHLGHARLELPEESRSGLVLVLGPKEPAARALAGWVLHADGSPASGAYVSIGGGGSASAAVRADADGAFELALEPDSKPERVRAVLAGFLPAERELAGLDGDALGELELVLGGAARTITGRVVDGRGEPLAGAQVWTTDGDRFGSISTRAGDIDFMLSFDVESVMAGARTPNEDGRRARTDDLGGFVLSGLGARRYGLYAFHPRTQELAGPVEVTGGTEGVVLALSGDDPARAVAGRVTTYSGAPIAGARVCVQRKRPGAGRAGTHRADSSFHALTDGEGRFRFEALCTAGTELLVTADGFPDETLCALDSETDLESLLVRMPAACHLRVRLDDPASASTLEIEDERGEGLMVQIQIGGVLLSAGAFQLEGGVSDLITTDERARTLVLRKGLEIVARIPLQLRTGEVNEVRY